MVKQKSTLVAFAALGAMITTTLTATVKPVQAKPSKGALIIGGLAAYGVYSASKHRQKDNRNRYGYGNSGGYYGNNSSYNNGYNNGRERHGNSEPEHHNGNNGSYNSYPNGGYYGNNGSYNNGYYGGGNSYPSGGYYSYNERLDRRDNGNSYGDPHHNNRNNNRGNGRRNNHHD